MHSYRAHRDVTVLNDHLEVPGLGYLAVNAFVLHAAQPVVVDTGRASGCPTATSFATSPR